VKYLSTTQTYRYNIKCNINLMPKEAVWEVLYRVGKGKGKASGGKGNQKL